MAYAVRIPNITTKERCPNFYTRINQIDNIDSRLQGAIGAINANKYLRWSGPGVALIVITAMNYFAPSERSILFFIPMFCLFVVAILTLPFHIKRQAHRATKLVNESTPTKEPALITDSYIVGRGGKLAIWLLCFTDEANPTLRGKIFQLEFVLPEEMDSSTKKLQDYKIYYNSQEPDFLVVELNNLLFWAKNEGKGKPLNIRKHS
jgi:hypothetical protein